MPGKPTLVQSEPPALNLAPLPSQHIVHSAVFQNELQQRMAAFDTGITTLTVEMEGQQSAQDSAVKKIRDEAEREITAMLADHHQAKLALMARISDMQRGKRIAAAALDMAEETAGMVKAI